MSLYRIKYTDHSMGSRDLAKPLVRVAYGLLSDDEQDHYKLQMEHEDGNPDCDSNEVMCILKSNVVEVRELQIGKKLRKAEVK